MTEAMPTPILERPKANKALIVGGILSLLASLLHIATIIGGAEWYRFMGAGEDMAKMAEAGDAYPALITTVIAGVLAVWAAYAFSGAGLIRRLPFMRFCLTSISLVYLVRGIGGFILIMMMENPYTAQAKSEVTFLLVSSIIVFIYGAFYALGTVQIWPEISPKQS